MFPLRGQTAATFSDKGVLSLERVLVAAELLRQLDSLRAQSELAERLLSGLGLDDGVASVFGGSLSETAALLDGLNLDLRRALLARSF